MTAKHTPGPYMFLKGSENFEGAGDGMLFTVGDPYGHGPMHIADVTIRGWGHLTGSGACNYSPEKAAEIQNANVRLFKAAPDLLTALKAYQEQASSYHTACGHGEVGSVAECDGICECMAAAEAAIAKAEGRDR